MVIKGSDSLIGHRQASYRKLFKSQIRKDSLEALRKSTNKARVLGSSQFKQRIDHELDRPVESMGHGGDRISDVFKKLNQSSLMVWTRTL